MQEAHTQACTQGGHDLQQLEKQQQQQWRRQRHLPHPHLHLHQLHQCLDAHIGGWGRHGIAPPAAAADNASQTPALVRAARSSAYPHGRSWWCGARSAACL
jgi:hypothetical protein